MFDLVNDPQNQQITRDIYEAGGIVAAVCHGPAAILNITLSDGSNLLQDSNVTGFSNLEETEMGLMDAVPYSLEDEMKKRTGGKFEMTEEKQGEEFEFGGKKLRHWAPKVVVGKEGRIITGQNPASAALVAKRILELLGK
ncbi:MAG: hypothetical protein Q9166_002287 [cf. Caloplaca sp. 2 TL-2023]